MIAEIAAITVKQLNFYVKSLLEGDSHLQYVTVTGELSNFKNHYASGHWYFTLKDEDAAIRCVMFRAMAILWCCGAEYHSMRKTDSTSFTPSRCSP